MACVLNLGDWFIHQGALSFFSKSLDEMRWRETADDAYSAVICVPWSVSTQTIHPRKRRSGSRRDLITQRLVM